jgi:hypothetical protein
MSSFKSDRTNYKDRIRAGLLPLIMGGTLLAALQANIANYKAAEKNSQHMLTVTEPAQLAELYPLAFMTDTLRATSILTDPITGGKIDNAVAVEVTEEQYKRRRRGSSWRTVGTSHNQASAQMGTIAIEHNLLRDNAQDVRRKLDLSLVDRTAYARFYGSVAHSSHITYKNSRHRYVYRYVPDGLKVTAIAKVTRAGFGYSLAPSPLMPGGYPALQPGQVSPQQYISTLKSRFIGTLLATGGALFMMGWFALALLRNTAAERSMSHPLCALSAAGSAVAALGIWYVSVSWLYGLLGWLALLLGLYTALKLSAPREEF